MGYEVDFLTVGDGEKSGDAIALRFGNLYGKRDEQCVVVIDGGTKKSGAELVEHIKVHYKTNVVDLVISTHPDGDHCSGLTEVLENLVVKELWMHQPWDHADSIRDSFRDGRITNTSLSDNLRDDLQHAHDLETMAIEQGIPIREPFAGIQVSACGGWLAVLGPTVDYYEELLVDFDGAPAFNEAAAGEGRGIGLLETIKGAVKTAVNWVKESWGVETLEEPEQNATSAENNSSAIVLLHCDGKSLLLTGDAGVPALELAAEFAEQNGQDMTACSLTQIPHHGSRRNVGPTILDRIVGPPVAANSTPTKTAIVSAATHGAPKYPAKKVTNAYLRRGAKVIATQGTSMRHSHCAPVRNGWVPVEPVPFYTEVEE